MTRSKTTICPSDEKQPSIKSSASRILSFCFLSFAITTGISRADGKPLARYEIAGEDRKFVFAEATIDGSSIVVRSEKVAMPLAVR
jgi:hypothetical protein